MWKIHLAGWVSARHYAHLPDHAAVVGLPVESEQEWALRARATPYRKKIPAKLRQNQRFKIVWRG